MEHEEATTKPQVTIINRNEGYGDPVEFYGATLEEAVADMQSVIRACDPSMSEIVVTESDYEIVNSFESSIQDALEAWIDFYADDLADHPGASANVMRTFKDGEVVAATISMVDPHGNVITGYDCEL